MIRTRQARYGGGPGLGVNAVNAVVVTPDGHRAISGSIDTTLRVWDLESGEAIRTLHGHTSGVNAMALTSDGHRIVSGSDDMTLRVWDLESGVTIHSLQDHRNMADPG